MSTQNIVELTHFGFLLFTGRDAEKFLQGYTTCDLAALSEHQVMRGAVCNIQGRMVSNFLAARTSDGLLLRLNRDLVSKTATFLSKYIVFSKAEMHDISAEMTCYGVTGDYPAAVDLPYPQKLFEITHSDNGYCLKIDPSRYEIWTATKIEAAGDLHAWHRAELSNGIVWLDDATSEEYIPQMFNLHNLDGISFDKGCYLGQEIVARMQYRGELKKRLHLAETESNLTIGAKVVSQNGKTLGHVVAQAENQAALVIKADEACYLLEDGAELHPKELSAS